MSAYLLSLIRPVLYPVGRVTGMASHL